MKGLWTKTNDRYYWDSFVITKIWADCYSLIYKGVLHGEYTTLAGAKKAAERFIVKIDKIEKLMLRLNQIALGEVE